MKLVNQVANLLDVPLKGRFPDFFIVGGARCGTTSLWQYLRQHPRIFMPAEFRYKEPAYFCKIYGLMDRSRYLQLFNDAEPGQLTGEASTTYMVSPESPEWIHMEAPEARIIVSLRNPADRAYSHYKWMCEHGYEHCQSFTDALWAEENTRFGNEHYKHRNPENYYNYLYFRSGLYVNQLERYFSLFGRDRVTVLFFEEFIKDPAPAARSLYEFLGIDPNFTPKIQLHNPSSQEVPLDAALRTELLQRYEPSIRQLEKLLGRDLKQLWS